MDIVVRCKRCGERYHKRNGKTKFCEACRKEASREAQARWRKEHPGYLKEWRRRQTESC